LQVRGAGYDVEREVTGGYACDLLSCVMAKARRGNVWVTIQAHPNIVAVAVLLELAAIIITEGVEPEPATLQRAQSEHVAILTTAHATFSVVAELSKLGVKGTE
jgi:predicted transcriptional regulator